MVRNGELTERALARATGVSQPHIHNVLKGRRELSVEMADAILEALHLDAHDLLKQPASAANDRTAAGEKRGPNPSTLVVMETFEHVFEQFKVAGK
ncbi:MAG: helix-turn-helix domain-containing protein, partial [Bryobacteraceae bacterium]